MFRMIQNLKKNRSNEKGASAVEYGLLVALIAAVIVVAVLALGDVVKGAFTDTTDGICSTASAGTGC
jgi:pilus assembly protein Flp/PilA